MAKKGLKETFLSRFSLKFNLIVLVLIFVNSRHVLGFFGEWGPDLEGPWCATRPRGEDCCYGRDDYCSVPILGTECYCDVFCNDTAYDCCPDYWSHCHGYQVPTTTPRPTTLPPPRTTRDSLAPCSREGVNYRPGETIRDNCNNCTCELYTLPYRRYEWRCSQNVCLLRPELIKAVNDNPNMIWKASNYSELWGLTLDEGVRYRLGTFKLSEDVVEMTPLRVEDDVIPESFDARIKWPNILHSISDQGNCASSWAHSSAAVLSDRLAIETDGAIDDRLSIQHLLSCDTYGQLGCNGGHLDRAWWFLRQTGIVREDCYPLTSSFTGSQGACQITAETSRCPSGIEYRTEKRYQATPPYRIRSLEREIMKEIMDNGPVQAIFQVREDFFMYSRGVYKYTALTSLRQDSEQHMKSGFHSVRIVGWGAERTYQGDIIKYWICANSWGTSWGEDGYFRIVRGSDESSIESSVIGVWGRITGDPALRALLNENRRRRQRVERARKRRHLNHLRSREEQIERPRNRRHHKEEENKVGHKTAELLKKKDKLSKASVQDLPEKHKKPVHYQSKAKHNEKQTPKKHKMNQKNKHLLDYYLKHAEEETLDKQNGHKINIKHKHPKNSPQGNYNRANTKFSKEKIIYDYPDSM